MAKKSRKQPARAHKDNTGCISGLISIFDFRHGRSTPRLLSDRRHGSSRHSAGNGYSKSILNILTDFKEKHEDLDVIEKDDTGRMNVGTSVKVLMKEEMSKVKKMKRVLNAEIEQVKPVGQEVYLEKNHKQVNETSMLSCGLHVDDMKSSVSLVSDQSYSARLPERLSYNASLTAFMEEFLSDKHQCQELNLDCAKRSDLFLLQKSIDQPGAKPVLDHSILQKVLSEVAEALVNHKVVDAKQLITNTALHQSQEFIDALEILNSNKELLIKLLQKQKHTHSLQNDQDEKLSDIALKSFPEGGNLLEEETCNSMQCKEPVSHRPFQKQNVLKKFRKKDKSQETKLSKGNDRPEALNKIVVLKPTPPGIVGIQNPSSVVSPSSSPQSHYNLRSKLENDKISTHFSLKEIKRRLKYVAKESTKERQLISMDGVLHRIPQESQHSGDTGNKNASVGAGLVSKASSNSEKAYQPSSSSKRRNEKYEMKGHQLSLKHETASQRVGDCRDLSTAKGYYSLRRETDFQREARKHLAEMLTLGNEDGKLPDIQGSKSLGRILSLPEYNFLSPRLSPGREKETSLSPRHMRFSPLWHVKQENYTNTLSPGRQSVECSTCTGSIRNIDEVLDSNTTVFDTSTQDNISSTETSTPKEETLDPENAKNGNSLDAQPELNTKEPADVAEQCEDAGSSTWSRADYSEELLKPVITLVPASPVHLLVENSEAPERIVEKPERPSPVSVLEPLFLDEIISPRSTSAEHVEIPMQPLQIHFEENDDCAVVLTTSDNETNSRTRPTDTEAAFEYVRAVLEASGLSRDGLSGKWLSSNQLIDPSLFVEVEFSSVQVSNDPKHLFDCISEVLEEIYERFLGCTPWVSFVKPDIRPVPTAESLVQEVWQSMDRHLFLQLPYTLDHIIGKDMETRTWMDLRFETESAGIEMGGAILDKIMEEIILELWD